MYTAVKASFFLVATGERPVCKMAEYPGLENCVTTDDFFKITTLPRKVLVLGGGYIALEIASILCGFQIDTTLYHRSNLVKGNSIHSFDVSLFRHWRRADRQVGEKISGRRVKGAQGPQQLKYPKNCIGKKENLGRKVSCEDNLQGR